MITIRIYSGANAHNIGALDSKLTPNMFFVCTFGFCGL